MWPVSHIEPEVVRLGSRAFLIPLVGCWRELMQQRICTAIGRTVDVTARPLNRLGDVTGIFGRRRRHRHVLTLYVVSDERHSAREISTYLTPCGLAAVAALSRARAEYRPERFAAHVRPFTADDGRTAGAGERCWPPTPAWH